MSNRKLVGRVLLVIVVIALLAGGGYALYRYGYVRGVAAAGEGEIFFGHFPGGFWFPEGALNDDVRGFFDRPGAMMFDFDSHHGGMWRDYDHRSVPSLRYFASRTVLSPLSIIFRVVVWGFILWVAYRVVSTVFGGKGWQLSFHSQTDGDESTDTKATKKK